VAVSAQKRGVLPISQQSMFVLASLAYHDYEGLAVFPEEKPRLVRDLGDKRFFMLRNHGLLTVGPSISEAFVQLYQFEAACMIQLRAQAGGGELIEIEPKVQAGVTEMLKAVTRGSGAGALTWPALLRKLDRLDPSFRS
jgi:ribulose-5-phosphate 4-epimerase/fuculose-1-phosphate aldolase